MGATADARARVEDFTRTLERTPLDEIRLLGAVPIDHGVHRGAREDALQAAKAGGRADLAAEAMERVGAWAARMLQPGQYQVSLGGVAWTLETMDPRDQPQVAVGLQDAVLGLVVMDLVDEDVFDELIGPCRNLAGLDDPEG